MLRELHILHLLTHVYFTKCQGCRSRCGGGGVAVITTTHNIRLKTDALPNNTATLLLFLCSHSEVNVRVLQMRQDNPLALTDDHSLP